MTKTTADKIVDMVVESYIVVMGRVNWDAKTPEEQHDIVMILIKDALKALERAE